MTVPKTGVNWIPFEAPLFHEYVIAPFPDNVIWVPKQTVWSVPAFTFGNWFTLTVNWSVFWQPFKSTPVTVYVAVKDGENEILFTTPLSHVRFGAPDADNVTIEPKQTVWSVPALIIGNGFTKIETLSVAKHPLTSVPVTV